MHPPRTRRALPQDYAVDAQHSHRRAFNLPARRVPTRRHQGAQRIRAAARRGDVGARIVMRGHR